MRRGLSIFFGIILILVGLIKLLPLVGISVVIDGFPLDQWFPIVFIMIGLLELMGQEGSGWFWGIALLVFGGLKLCQLMNLAIPLINLLNIEAILLPVFIFIYGLKSLAVSK